jgi:two-component system nitrate/nitrite response regulator NarL
LAGKEIHMSDLEQSVRIVIADAQPMFRDALRDLLEQQPDFQVVGEAADGGEAIEKVKQLKPDLFLLDLAMPQMSRLQVLRSLSTLPVQVRTIVLANAIERSQVVEALKFGARGVILKDVATALLFKGIRAVLAGEYWVAHADVAKLVDSLRAGMPEADLQPGSSNGSHLSRRELEIVSAIVEGCTNKDIAQNFSLSEQTVKHHLTNIYAKVGVSNRLELAFYAVQHNLISQ